MNHSFLIGTHSGLYHLTTDAAWCLLSCQRLFTGHHYGLSVDLEGKKVYSKNQDEFFNVLELDSLKVIKTIPFSSKPGHVHQALRTEKGVFLTDTLHNRLTLQKEDGSCEHLVIDGKEGDVNHLNSLFLFDNEIACLLHNKGAQHTEVMTVAYSSESGFVPSRRWYLRDNGCHNIFINQGSVFYNASELGHFVRVDFGTGLEISRKRFKGHSKGLAVTDKNIVIGVSDHAKREARKHTSSSLVVMDRTGLSVQAEIQIKTDEGEFIGNINELRCISEPDYSEGTFT